MSTLVSGAKLTVECPIKPYLGQNPEKRPYLGVSRNTYRVLHQELD